MNNKILALSGILIGFLIIITSLPVNSNYDITASVTVTKSQIINVDTKISPHVLYKLPDLAGLISTSDMKIILTGGGKSVSKSIGTIYITQEYTYNIVLPNIPITTDRITIDLYESNSRIDSKEITL